MGVIEDLLKLLGGVLWSGGGDSSSNGSGGVMQRGSGAALELRRTGGGSGGNGGGSNAGGSGDNDLVPYSELQTAIQMAAAAMAAKQRASEAIRAEAERLREVSAAEARAAERAELDSGSLLGQLESLLSAKRAAAGERAELERRGAALAAERELICEQLNGAGAACVWARCRVCVCVVWVSGVGSGAFEREGARERAREDTPSSHIQCVC